MRGEALQGITVNRPVCLTLHTQDRFGNSRATGSEAVEVQLKGPPGDDSSPPPL